MQFVFDDEMINCQRILLNFSQIIKNLLFFNPYKICKHSLISIDFIASVYEHLIQIMLILMLIYVSEL